MELCSLNWFSFDHIIFIDVFDINYLGLKVDFGATYSLRDTLYLTPKVLNFWKFSSYCSLKPLWSGMEEVVPARTSPTRTSPIPSHCASIVATSTKS